MPTLGILGGSEIAKMLAQAAAKLSIETVIFTSDTAAPACQVTPHIIIGDTRDETLLRQFAAKCDIVTLDNADIEITALQRIESFGTAVYPKPDTLASIQDKLTQKRTLQAANLAVARFLPVQMATDVMQAIEAFGFPVWLKPRHTRADAQNTPIFRSADIPVALEKLHGQALIAEAATSFVRELAVIVVRGRDGQVRLYPVVELVTQNQQLQRVLCPAGIEETTAFNALDMAQKAIETINGIGVFGVELLELEDSTLVVQDIIPYPPNAGYLTIEGMITSQFENHVRAVMGLPLGNVDQIAPATALVNIIGERNGTPYADALNEALAIGGAHIHLYGNREIRPGRTMGHITVLGYTADGAEKVGRLALSKIRL